jgi:hypothetical protein
MQAKKPIIRYKNGNPAQVTHLELGLRGYGAARGNEFYTPIEVSRLIQSAEEVDNADYVIYAQGNQCEFPRWKRSNFIAWT